VIRYQRYQSGIATKLAPLERKRSREMEFATPRRRKARIERITHQLMSETRVLARDRLIRKQPDSRRLLYPGNEFSSR
jgi:hypothetical protein